MLLLMTQVDFLSVLAAVQSKGTYGLRPIFDNFFTEGLSYEILLRVRTK